MGFGSKLFKGHKLSFHRFASEGTLSRKQFKNLRSKLGLTGSSKWARQVKRSINPRDLVSSGSPVSATSVGYQYNGRSLSQLMGGN